MKALGIRPSVALVLGLSLTPAGVSVADSEFMKFMQQQQSEFQEYKDQRDKEFTNFLKAQWKEFRVFAGEKRDPEPKPVKMPLAPPKPKPAKSEPVVVPAPAPAPVVTPVKPEPKPVPEALPPVVKPQPKPEPEKKPVVTRPVPVPAPVVKPVPETKPAPVPRPELIPAPERQPVVRTPVTRPVEIMAPPVVPPKPVVKPVVAAPKGKRADVNYFGRRLSFYYDPKFETRLDGHINETAISNFWSTLSKADYDQLLTQLNRQRKPLQANDWSYVLLVNELSKSIYPRQKNEQSLFTWFMLIKSGFQARLAYADSNTFLLLPTEQRLYAVSYFTFNNKRYYALGMDGNKVTTGRVYTYNGQYPGATKALDMSIRNGLNTERRKQHRVVSFKYRGKPYNVKLDVDRNTISYLKTYPQMDIDQYFAARVNEDIGNPILAQLREIIKGKSEEEAVNILLLFVQNAFKYKTDQGQFGEENYLFPEETLYYPYSDCEDRSVIFAWLVRSLTGLEVVGLDFPGHIATAVKFKTNVSGDKIRHNGRVYTVTDPTYINASAGMTMPNFKNVKPKVIQFRAF